MKECVHLLWDAIKHPRFYSVNTRVRLLEWRETTGNAYMYVQRVTTEQEGHVDIASVNIPEKDQIVLGTSGLQYGHTKCI